MEAEFELLGLVGAIQEIPHGGRTIANKSKVKFEHMVST